jgi:hypothetical protein
LSNLIHPKNLNFEAVYMRAIDLFGHHQIEQSKLLI